MSNFTIDDTAATLFYGPGWGVAPQSDPALAEYFQHTYHATQTAGAVMNVTFSGSAIYLYGSKGPNHGKFSVRYDSFVQQLSASDPTLSYRQLLFSAQLPPGTHSLTLTNVDTNQGWLDLDFVTITEPRNMVWDSNVTVTTASEFSSTISPPAVGPTSIANASSDPLALPTAGSATVSQSFASSFNPVTLILSIVFGILAFCLLVSVVWLLVRRKRRPRKTSSSSPSDDNVESTQYPGSAFLRPQSIQPVIPEKRINRFDDYPPSPFHADSSRTAYLSERESEEMNQLARPVIPAARPWSPFKASMRMFGSAKDGADSMKSTFLKV